jgi:hypothetical protein
LLRLEYLLPVSVAWTLLFAEPVVSHLFVLNLFAAKSEMSASVRPRVPQLRIEVGIADVLRTVNPAAEILFVSARTGEDVGSWCDWLRLTGRGAARARGPARRRAPR